MSKADRQACEALTDSGLFKIGHDCGDVGQFAGAVLRRDFPARRRANENVVALTCDCRSRHGRKRCIAGKPPEKGMRIKVQLHAAMFSNALGHEHEDLSGRDEWTHETTDDDRRQVLAALAAAGRIPSA